MERPAATEADVRSLLQHAHARLLESARRAIQEERWAEARELLSREPGAAPPDPELQLLAAAVAEAHGERSEARRLLLLAWDAGLPQAVVNLIRLDSDEPQSWARARPLLDSALRRFPQHRGLRLAQARRALETGQLELAVRLYDQLLSEDEESLEAREGLAAAYNERSFELHEAGETEQALFLMRRALLTLPEWTGLHVNLGRLFLALGREGPARREFLLAQERDPLDPIATFNLARLARRQGSLSDASDWYHRTLALDRDYPDARPELASVLHDLGDYERATELLREELRRDPGCAVCRCNLGLTLSALQRFDEARVDFERALLLDRSHFPAHYNLAVLDAGRGDLDSALQHLEACGALDPSRTAEWLALDQAAFGSLAAQPRFRGLQAPAPRD